MRELATLGLIWKYRLGAPTVGSSEAAFLNIGLYKKRKSEQKNRQTNQDYRDDAAQNTVRDQRSVNADDHAPVQNDVEHKQSEENKSDPKMNGSPVVAAQPPE